MRERGISRGLALWAPQGLPLPRGAPRRRRSLPVCIRILLLSPRCAHDRARTESRIERTYICTRIHVYERESRFLLIVRRPYVPTIVRLGRSKNCSMEEDAWPVFSEAFLYVKYVIVYSPRI